MTVTGVLKRILLGGAVLIALLILSDLALGVLLRWRTEKGREEMIGRRVYPAPYTMTAMKGVHQEEADILINHQGFRFPHDLRSRKGDRFRCFILGGSFAFGSGASSGDSYYLRELRERFPDVDFINAAGSSFVANQQFIQLALRVLPYDPDAVLIVDGFNDLALPMVFGQEPGAPWRWNAYRDILSGQLPRIVWGYVKVKSQFYRLLSRLWLARRAEKPRFREEIFPEICREYRRASTLTYQLCRARGIAVYHCVQPQLAVGKPLSKTERGLSLPAVNRAMGNLYPELAESAAHTAERYEVPFLNLLNVFSNQTETLYVDYCHVNDRGQRIVGSRIAGFLDRSGFPEQVIPVPELSPGAALKPEPRPPQELAASSAER